MLRWALIALGIYFGAAIAGGFLSGALPAAIADISRYLPRAASDLHQGLPPRWSRRPLRSVKVLATAFLFLGLVTLTVASHVTIFVMSSPLYTLYFYNELTGRPPPHGRLVQWYAGWPARWRDFRRGNRSSP